MAPGGPARDLSGRRRLFPTSGRIVPVRSLRSNETVSILPQRRQQNVRSVCLRAVLVAIKSITTPQRPHRGVSLSFVS